MQFRLGRRRQNFQSFFVMHLNKMLCFFERGRIKCDWFSSNIEKEKMVRISIINDACKLRWRFFSFYHLILIFDIFSFHSAGGGGTHFFIVCYGNRVCKKFILEDFKDCRGAQWAGLIPIAPNPKFIRFYTLHPLAFRDQFFNNF